MGFHQNASTFDAPADDLDAARLSLWFWAEAIVIDRAVEVYAHLIDEAGTVALARRQCRLWRAALFDDPSALRAAAVDLAGVAAELGLSDDVPDGIDGAIVEELVDIVTARFRSSRKALRTFSLVLVSISSRLGSARSGR